MRFGEKLFSAVEDLERLFILENVLDDFVTQGGVNHEVHIVN